eukprot:SAG31_NODE_4613_length_3097_cov_1.783189_3_plen_71_part_00
MPHASPPTQQCRSKARALALCLVSLSFAVAADTIQPVTGLHAAAKDGDVAMIEKLLDKGHSKLRYISIHI